MKKTLLFICFSVFAFVSYAQFEVRAKSDNSLITDGQTIAFSEAGCGFTDPCNWKFTVTNTASEDIYMRIFIDDLTNTDGTNFQLCFAGVCLNNVTLNSGYPTNPAMIALGATSSNGNNFWNLNPSDTSIAMSWTMRFQAFDAGGTQIGTPLNVTYSFDPNLSIEEEEFTSVEVFPTQVKNELNVTSNQKLTAEFYDILGKKVKDITVDMGKSKINVSDLSPQLYIIRFTDEAGKTLIRKIIVE
ncbi:T9SS type A sorting domain-containing protein [Winogradskyella luteola]|uniref:T9SS type A sorting domain-containing protein n=1 Tax=Winogradskyella luteola TaxID=2828330 RepID=A0A9X1JNV3_9FLAO|nr:T9SS type A sorting domain-containing protein [Winogradskyella luteola]MBV7269786.1 T9SS type A sorting domain-containing protein [Winogradskyella luteola]